MEDRDVGSEVSLRRHLTNVVVCFELPKPAQCLNPIAVSAKIKLRLRLSECEGRVYGSFYDYFCALWVNLCACKKLMKVRHCSSTGQTIRE